MTKVHYRRMRGYRRYPGRGGRPVYYLQMSDSEVRERRVLYGVIGILASMIGGAALWILSMI